MSKSQIFKNAMDWLAIQPKTIFIGQNICYPDSQFYSSLTDIPLDKKIEMPVAEELQMGITLGLALEGYIPISIYPRIDFLLLALNQLVNHVDKIEAMSKGIFKPGIIIRTLVGKKHPLNAGLQHTQDHTFALRMMLKNMEIYDINHTGEIMRTYQLAYNYASFYKKSVLIVEDIND